MPASTTIINRSWSRAAPTRAAKSPYLVRPRAVPEYFAFQGQLDELHCLVVPLNSQNVVPSDREAGDRKTGVRIGRILQVLFAQWLEQRPRRASLSHNG